MFSIVFSEAAQSIIFIRDLESIIGIVSQNCEPRNLFSQKESRHKGRCVLKKK